MALLTKKDWRDFTMNFTTCDENCVYQKDGYCILEEYNHINVVADCDCIYFVAINVAEIYDKEQK